MKHRLVATLGAVAVAGAVALGVSGTANAMTPTPTASQADCNNAAGLTATAMANFNGQLAVVTARLKALGFTTNTISSAEQLLNSGPLTTDMKVQLLQMVYAEHIQGQLTAADGTAVATLLDGKVRVDAAQAVQAAACINFTPTVAAPATTVVPPTTTVVPPAANPGAVLAPVPTYTMPSGAPAAGDGSGIAGN